MAEWLLSVHSRIMDERLTRVKEWQACLSHKHVCHTTDRLSSFTALAFSPVMVELVLAAAMWSTPHMFITDKSFTTEGNANIITDWLPLLATLAFLPVLTGEAGAGCRHVE